MYEMCIHLFHIRLEYVHVGLRLSSRASFLFILVPKLSLVIRLKVGQNPIQCARVNERTKLPTVEERVTNLVSVSRR